MTAGRTAARLAWAIVVCAASAAGAQTLPSEPISFAGGNVTVGGDVSASMGSADPGFFNYTDYEHSALRMLQIDVAAAAKAGPHFTLLGELRTENFDSVRPYALYVRIRPWTKRDFDIQVGRIPPTFGAFARRTYASDNPLIAYPLAYQYLTTIRPDALPASVDELLQKRGLGWRVRYTIGDTAADHGVPLVSAFRWDTGVEAHGTIGIVTLSGAVTVGTVSNPLFTDDNGGRQLAGRVELRPVAGLILGSSVARGPFVGDAAAKAVSPMPQASSLTQTAWGVDAEFSRDYYLVRFETIGSSWRLPIPNGPNLDLSLGSMSTFVEGRYKIMPGLYAAARLDHLGFSDVTGTTVTEPWDAPVTRIELGGGYSLQRNLVLKGSYQHDARDGGPALTRTANLVAVQIVYWF
jgi:hypothetical protein